MTSPFFVETLLQSTAEAEPDRAFEFWQVSISALSGVDIWGQSKRAQGVVSTSPAFDDELRLLDRSAA